MSANDHGIHGHEDITPPPPPETLNDVHGDSGMYAPPLDYDEHGKPPLTAFLQKLLEITSVCDPDVACWDADGLTFRIKKSDAFQNLLENRYKGKTNTFVRQLHFYGFKKLETDDFGRWGFSHQFFQKDRPELIHQIKRKTRRKKTKSKSSSLHEDTSKFNGPEGYDPQVEELRSEVDDLKVNVANLAEHLALMREDLAALKPSYLLDQSDHPLKRSRLK